MQIVKRVCGCFAAMLLVVISLGKLADLMQRKDSDFKYTPLFEQEEDFDVLFFGTSHVLYGIFPMELWKDYGIVSYNCGIHGSALPTTYWQMESILDYTVPELVVIDGYVLGADTMTNTFSGVHCGMDTFPLTSTKWSAVQDLLSDEETKKLMEQGRMAEAEEKTRLSLLWDFSVYHSRWNELEKNDFALEYSKEGGAQSLFDVAVPDKVRPVPADVCLNGDTTGTEYLGRMIQECKKRRIQVLLTYLPFPASEGDQKDANRLYDIAREYGVPYINFLDMDLVNYDTDCYDPNSHLNVSGARKVTEYLGRYLKENYNFEDHREDAAYSSWHDGYDAYKEYKEFILKLQQELDVYFICLADKNYNILLETKDRGRVIWNSQYYVTLLENMGIDASRITDRTDGIYIQEMGRQVDYFEGFHDWQKYGINGGMQEDADMRITVFDKDSMEIVDMAAFALQGKEDMEDGYVAVTGVYRQPDS